MYGGESRNVWLDARRSGDRTGGGNEAIPAPRHRFDETRFAGVVIERRPKLADGGSQHRVGDELVAPNLIEQSVRGEQGPGLPHERAQDREWRRRERDSRSVAQQACVRLVELESVEAHSYRIRTGRRSGVVGAFSHFDMNRSLDRHATTLASNPLVEQRRALFGGTPAN